MKKITLSLLFLFNLFVFSQYNAQNRVIKLKSGEVSLPAQSGETSLITIENKLGNEYVVVQFNKIPTTSEKEALKKEGIYLMEYLPNYAFIASFKNVSNANLKQLNIRSIHPFLPMYKLSKAVAENEVPDWAQHGNMIDLMIEAHSNVNLSDLKAFLSDKYTILGETEHLGYLEVSINRVKTENLINHPSVKMIDFIPAPPEKEDREGRTLHRSNMLNSEHPMGRKYDGSGVSMAIADDGPIGPHIDIKGRVTQFSNANNGSHGDMTTGIAMGAGNLNPYIKGMASGAYLYYYDIGGYPHISNAVSNLNNRGVVITSTSYSEGCNAGYTSTTRTVDQQTRQNPTLLHVFSAGNSSGSSCGANAYGAGTPWGTITGGRKQGKSVIATGNIYYTENLVTSSSRGPAADGRIKPDICANGGNQLSTEQDNTYQVGGGTSAASPGIAGVAAQLYQGFRDINNGTTPQSALIKASMLNTAKDLGNRGPDFSFGWGHVNAHRAMKLLEENRYLSSNISQNGVNLHTVTIPAGTEQLKFMLYWADFEGSTNSAQALINNLDLKVITPIGDTINPWILDPTPNTTNLSRPATRGVDNLNNMEQVEIDSITPGVYTVLINGKVVPQGPQSYFLLWETKTDEIEVTYPHGGEPLVPGRTETIRWDAVETSGNTILEYSVDSGMTWSVITVTNGAARYRNWIIPNTISDQALVRVTKGNNVGISANTFSIINRPSNINAVFQCTDSIKITWDSVPGATAYEISLLGATHMDSVGRSTTNEFTLKNLNLFDDNWVSVRAIINDFKGERSNAQLLNKNIFNCPFSYDIAIDNFTSPNNSKIFSCGTPKTPVTISLRNTGDSAVQNVPLQLTIGATNSYDTISSMIAPGDTLIYTFQDSINTATANSPLFIKVRNLLPSDENFTNDSIQSTFDIFNTVFTLPYTNDFENFTNCQTINNCGGTSCSLSGGWVNADNGVEDDFDMRVNSGSTPSTGTGPSADHSPGTSAGKYIYSEASNGCYLTESYTTSPCFDLTNTISPQFSFWYHMSGTSVGQLQVDIYSNGQWTNNITSPLSGSQGNFWRQKRINLSSYVGQIVNLRFKVTTGSSWSSDIAIDDISFTDISTGLSDGAQKTILGVYPNPTNGEITVLFDKVVNDEIEVISLDGKIIQTVRSSSKQLNLNLESVAKGIYFIRLKNSPLKEKIVVY